MRGRNRAGELEHAATVDRVRSLIADVGIPVRDPWPGGQFGAWVGRATTVSASDVCAPDAQRRLHVWRQHHAIVDTRLDEMHRILAAASDLHVTRRAHISELVVQPK